MTTQLRFSQPLAPPLGDAVSLRFGLVGEVDPPIEIPYIGSESSLAFVAAWRRANDIGASTQLTWQLAKREYAKFAALWSRASSIDCQRQTPWAEGSSSPASTILAPSGQAASVDARLIAESRDAVIASIVAGLEWGRGALVSSAGELLWGFGLQHAGYVEATWRAPSREHVEMTMRHGIGSPWSTRGALPWQAGITVYTEGSPWTIPTDPVVPGPTPCYTPPPGDNVFMRFASSLIRSTSLRFSCINDRIVIVPIRSVYVVVNNTFLRRVSGDIQLPCPGLSSSIDVDSWTWSFNATLPASARDAVMPDNNGPIELEANVNGNLYRFLAENISSDRTFGQHTIRVSGRGKSAFLAAPYAPVLTFANSSSRTAQQLMADVLTFNGVSVGWDVDWRLTDWLVPAGAFAMQGTYIEGLSAIAGAAGAYLQPHPTDDVMRVLLRYPVAPWEWDADDADYELPAAVTLQEGIEWLERPTYNRVFVRGASQGIIGQVTRGGTAGDLVAPMVVDPLVTAAAAARQRGISILGNTGRKLNVSLRLPVLAETGVIEPGKFVRYVEGSEIKYGIVRATSVEVRSPEVWQSLQVEVQG